MKVLSLEEIDGIWTTKKMQMVTKKGRKTLHKTIFEFSDIKLPEDVLVIIIPSLPLFDIMLFVTDASPLVEFSLIPICSLQLGDRAPVF